MIAANCGLSSALHRQVKLFSSGMKQRARLGAAFFSDVPLLLLDEPCSNLDSRGVDWYHSLVSSQLDGRIMVIASNIPREYETAAAVIPLK
jgi:ABC-type multidrug transport system ATPase subunit